MHINTFQIGADPEFCVVDPTTKSRLNASSYTSGLNTYGKVGFDHGGAVIELRPDPSYTVKGLLTNIKTLLEEPRLAPLKNKIWRGGAFFHDMPMGGHVHIELPAKGHHNVPDAVYDKRMAALDHVVRELEFLNILPKEECAKRRSGGGYGQFGYMHPVNSGQFTRIEYRTPCSWLFDPRNAFVTITGLKLAAVNPDYATEKLGKGDPKERFVALVKFFRAFAPVDEDAAYVIKHILRSVSDKVAKAIEAKPDQDFKEAWAKFSA